MLSLQQRPSALALAASAAACTALLAAPGAPASVQSRLDARSARTQALRSAIAADTGHIAALAGSIAKVQARLAPVEAKLDADRAQLAATRAALAAAHARLARLQVRLARADRNLTRLLISRYEGDTPDGLTVVLDAKGFADLIERIDFLKRVRDQDAAIITNDRRVRTTVIAQATRLGQLQVSEQALTASILDQRNQIDHVRLALVSRRIQYEQARSKKSSKLAAARAEQARLEHALGAIHSQSAAAGRAGAQSNHVLSGGGFTFPMPAGAASPPGSWSQDQGVDVSAPGHTPLLAVGSGTIVLHGIGGFGPSAPVLHLDDGRYVYYGHAGPGNMLPIGTHVSAGQTISEVGAGIVGISTGPHLEIGFSDASGTPAPGTSGTMLALLHAAYGG